MIIVTVHGNGATPESFSFIKMCLPEHSYLDLSYLSSDGFTANLLCMEARLAAVLAAEPDETFFFVSHSLGGIYAAHLALIFPSQTAGMVSMSTPYNGSEAAPALGMFFPCQLFSDIAPTSKPIRSIKHSMMPCPITCIITTAGQSSMWQKMNDGIVSHESMSARKGARNVEVFSSHHEICLSRRAVSVIAEAVAEAAILTL